MSTPCNRKVFQPRWHLQYLLQLPAFPVSLRKFCPRKWTQQRSTSQGCPQSDRRGRTPRLSFWWSVRGALQKTSTNIHKLQIEFCNGGLAEVEANCKCRAHFLLVSYTHLLWHQNSTRDFEGTKAWQIFVNLWIIKSEFSKIEPVSTVPRASEMPNAQTWQFDSSNPHSACYQGSAQY